ncbi:hypothetical protein [Fodinicola feengrottensis]|uniref:hypothetical protein n=1 Tax=Fodinicola feengrottensis TaxID=435914 RepID=UPI00244239F8|nr:hypothetical protein [Fodinicola feengrottensis]
MAAHPPLPAIGGRSVVQTVAGGCPQNHWPLRTVIFRRVGGDSPVTADQPVGQKSGAAIGPPPGVQILFAFIKEVGSAGSPGF